MKRFLAYTAAIATALVQVACIHNDLPYPVVELEILSIRGEGFTANASAIDPLQRTVTLRLDEQTDVRNVRITSVEYSEGATLSRPLEGTFDLRAPLYVTLSLYQDYEWTILAEQQIPRRFTVEGQIGDAEIDVENCIVRARVTEDVDLKNVRVTEMKLGPDEITDYSPTAEELTDFESIRFVTVGCHGRTERWLIELTPVAYTVMVARADLWLNTAELAVRLETPAETVTLDYRRQGDQEWLPARISASGDGINFTGHIEPAWSEGVNDAGLTVSTIDPATGVHAGRTYEYRLTADGAPIEEATFTTAEGDTIPFGDMEDGSLSCFTVSNVTAPFWGSGNNSFTTALCTQQTFEGMGGAHCARLAGTKAPVVGILAAGNLFSGTFTRSGFDGWVDFGQDYTWTARPTALRLKYHARVGRADEEKHPGAGIKKGDMDIMSIFVAVVDWESRHRVFSGTSECWGMWSADQTDHLDEGAIIGYGMMTIRESTTGERMIETTIPMRYYDTQAKPQQRYKLVISCSTSFYGDYMTGCTTNELYVDDFEWVY